MVPDGLYRLDVACKVVREAVRNPVVGGMTVGAHRRGPGRVPVGLPLDDLHGGDDRFRVEDRFLACDGADAPDIRSDG
mgnify:CR=1 FL=1